jgi:hypothetical protein
MTFSKGDRVICTSTFGIFGGAYKGETGVVVEATWPRPQVHFEKSGKRETPVSCIAKI